MALTAGSRLGPYEIQQAIGAGGMGEVYRARDTRLSRDVAIKILPADLSADSSRLERFEQEARLLSALNHPNILAIFDVGEHDGIRYMVSELLEGETVRERMQQGTVPLRKACEYAVQIAHGLAAAHEKGIVHRDLKPENVFLTTDGRLKLLDFGLATARRAAAAADATQATVASQAGAVLGTVGYMSPEQVRGKPADARSDLFSLGTVLYEMACGQRAFTGDSSVEVMNSILKDDPPDLSAADRKVPPALERVIRRCLEKSADERFQSARDLGFALEAVSAPSGASEVRRAAAEEMPRRRNRVMPFAIIALLAAAALAYVAGAKLNPPPPPRYTQLTFDPGFAGPARYAPSGDAVVYSAAWNGGATQLYWQRASFSQSRPLGVDADVMGVAENGDMVVIVKHHYHASWLASGTLARMPVEGGEPRPILDDVYWADISRDGKNFAVVVSGGGKQRLEYPIGKVLYETPGWLTDVRISPDGQHIAFLEHPIVPDDIGWVAVVDMQGVYRKLTQQNASCHGLAWTPDGKEIWHTASIHGEEAGLYAVDLSGHMRAVLRSPIELQLQDISRSGEVLLESVRYNLEIGVKQGDEPTRSIQSGGRTDMSTVSSDGRHMLLCHFEGSDYKVYITRTGGNSPVELGDGFGSGMTADNGWVAAMLVAKPHKLILYPTGAGQAREYDLGGLTAAFSGSENGVTFSRDGRLAMFTAYDAARNFRDYLLDLTSGKLRAVSSVATQDGKLSPDGTRAVTTDIATGKPMLLDLASGKTSAVSGFDAHGEVLGWGADGASLLVWDQELPAKIYSLDPMNGRRKLVQTVETNGAVGTMYGRVAVSGDGRTAAYRLRRGLYALYTATGVR